MSKVFDPSYLRISDLSVKKGNFTILFEDNEACITKTEEGYIKGDRMKNIDSKYLFTYELQQ